MRVSANFRLKELRTSAGLSQANVGDKLGVAQQTVGKWESGRTTPDPTTIVKLASLFGVTTDYLLGCTDIPNIYVDTKKNPLPKNQERAHQIASSIVANAQSVEGEPIPQDAEALVKFVRKIVGQVLAEQLQESNNPAESQDRTT